MKQTVRENRQGKIRVTEYLILDDAPEVPLLRSRMEMCEESHDCYTRWVWFTGCAPEFEPLMVGERPPEYEAIFTRHNGGPGVELTFRRRPGEDRRIEEFKEAGAAGTQVYIDPRKVLRTAEQEPVVLSPAKRAA
jgi:hypothetical protein